MSGLASNSSNRRAFWYLGSWCLTCTAAFVLVCVLLATIIFFVLDIPHGMAEATWRGITVSVLKNLVFPFIKFLAEIVKLLFPLPIIVIILVAVLTWGPQGIREWLASAKLDIGGFKLEGRQGSPEAFKKEVGQAERAVEGAKKEIDDAYASGAPYMAELRERFAIPQSVSELAREIAVAIGPDCPPDYRLTLYVPDLIFDARLYQFSEYFNKEGQQTSKGKVARTFSIRYGIIGRVWRSGVTEIEGELISSADRDQLGTSATSREVVRFIARRWGLTLEEAALVRPFEAYGAVRIESGGTSLGIVYFDSKVRNGFGRSEQQKELEAKIEKIVEESRLAAKMLELNREVEPKSRIRVFASP